LSEWIERFSRQAVAGLDTSYSPVVTTEHLAAVGPVLIPALEDFIRTHPEGETRTLASILLLSFGSTTGLSDVIAELRREGPNAILAARKLQEAKIDGSREMIVNVL